MTLRNIIVPIVALALLALSAAVAVAAPIPSANEGNWLVGINAGIPGGVRQYTAGQANDRASTGTVIDMTAAPYNCDPTGVADCRDALQDAINAVSGITLIWFPPGRYRFDSGNIYIGYKDNFTIRGAGFGLTEFDIRSNQTFLRWNSPGGVDTNDQAISGTKTKGTTTLTVSNGLDFALTEPVAVWYENEVDPTRMQAGSPPVWSSRGYPWSRKMLAIVTARTSTSITIEPGLPADGTNLAMRVSRFPLTGEHWLQSNIGIEDLTVDLTNTPPSSEVYFVFNVTAARYCWFYGVHVKNWPFDNDNGSAIVFGESYRCEVRFSRFHSLSGKSADGAIQSGLSTGIVVEDNIIEGGWGDSWFYGNGNEAHFVISHNYVEPGPISIFHGAHPSLNLLEGNDSDGHKSDAYHGSSSNNNLVRNRLRSAFPVVLNRLKRNYLIRGNVFGINGTNTPDISFGNPNIFNGYADGFAGPTGLSTQAGQPDYLQPGYGPNEYIIQPSDIFAGDFWEDWEATGTLTSRTSDTVGVFNMANGRWFVGASPTGAADFYISGWWDSKGSSLHNGTVTAVLGSTVTISWGSGSLPLEGTTLQFYFGPAGWQERDLDVQATTTLEHNFYATSSGTGSVQNPIDNLEDSDAYESKPWWFGSLDFPAFIPGNTSTHVSTRIPAGYRYANNNSTDYLGGGGGSPSGTPQCRAGRAGAGRAIRR